MHQHALWYSADPAVTIGQLRKEDYVFDDEIHDLQDVQGRVADYQLTAVVQGTADYFYGFSLLPSAPYIVYAMGDISLLQRPKIAIVGPRAMTEYGKQVVEHIFDVLPGYDVVTISGGADGVDMLCHRLSLEKSIPTIVVLGGGLRWFWRSRQQSFLQKVVDAGGLILSEFKLDFKPTHYTFPQRNRIVAGLADVVCVPEARAGSGSLITVDFALGMKKPVYGASADMFRAGSAGLLSYMAEGKVSVMTDVHLVLDRHFEQQASSAPVASSFSLDPLQEQIVSLCMQEEVSIDRLTVQLGSDATAILQALTILEMYGLIIQSAPNIYRYAQKIAKGC